MTRYWRAVQVPRPLGHLLSPAFSGAISHMRERFLSAGYAWVSMDVRGSGASSGTRPCPWSPDELDDGAQVLDWITAQAWSNGVVGALGNSYSGTAAELLITRHHPALRAVAPRFSLHDIYADVLAPGGAHLRWFAQQWHCVNAALDRNDFGAALAQNIRLAVQSATPGASPGRRRLLRLMDTERFEARLAAATRRILGAGVRRVDGDWRSAQLKAALVEHGHNYAVRDEARAIVYRDDESNSPDPYIDLPGWRNTQGTLERLSPHTHADRIEAAGVPIFSVSGWFDADYQHAAIKRHLRVRHPGNRLLLGPWDHGGTLNISPHDPRSQARHDHTAELLAFFDAHLRGRATLDPSPVRYFTMGAEKWQVAATWPPPGAHAQTLYLAPGRTLSRDAPTETHSDHHRFAQDASSGLRSRWRTFIGPHQDIGYPDRPQRDTRLLCYDSPPLADHVEVTGHPVLHIHLHADTRDGALFAYLEELHADGRVTYVTEGILRAIHRKPMAPPERATPVPHHSFRRADAQPMRRDEIATLSFGLWPTSYRFNPGSRVRLALAAADMDNFGQQTATLRQVDVLHSPTYPSRLILPVVGACPLSAPGT